jgi:hypothetical protein
MKRILLAVAGGLLIGAFAAQAKLPAPPPKSEAEQKAAADKAAATKAKEAELLGKAQDRAAANYKKNKGVSMGANKSGRK